MRIVHGSSPVVVATFCLGVPPRQRLTRKRPSVRPSLNHRRRPTRVWNVEFIRLVKWPDFLILFTLSSKQKQKKN